MPMAVLAGCGGAAETPAPPLMVAAASDLQTVMPDLARRFQTETGRKVEFVLGSSTNLALQIRQGAPFDVFLSADRSRVEALAKDGLVRPDSLRPYAVGSVALVVHRDTAASITAPADLTRPEVRHVAIANPQFAPYGAAAKQALESAGVWDAIQPKLVLAETVRQALQFVQSGNAEAGLVGKAIADVPEVVVHPIAPDQHRPIVQALGVVAASKQAEAAERFAAFVLGPEGQSALASHGFQPPADPR